MLHNSNTVRILYENTHIFEKLMNSAFKQNQVWYNQMSQFCHIMYSGEHESSRLGLIFDWMAGKGWNKKIKTLISFRITSLPPILSHFFSLRMELPSSSYCFTAFNSWLYQISWFSYYLRPTPVLDFVLTFVFVGQYLPFSHLLFFAIL